MKLSTLSGVGFTRNGADLFAKGWLGQFRRSIGKVQIGGVDRAAVVLVIEPDERAAGVYRADDAVPASRPGGR